MEGRVIDRQELARQLGLPPRTVRRLVENYREWLSSPGSGRFSALDLARLQIASRMTLAGRPRTAILDALATTKPAGERQEDGPQVDLGGERGRGALSGSRTSSSPRASDRPVRTFEAVSLDHPPALPGGEPAAARGDAEVAVSTEPLATEIGRLRDVILEHAARERQDRDRVLMALVRTQQEVSHLRSEIGTLRSRKDRKRGMLRRFFG